MAVLTMVAPPAGAVAQVFSAAQVPARGTQVSLLTIPYFGRYAITVHSAQGVALQLVDRMAGPGDVEGVPGAQDGRIDAFLERGTYQIKLLADAHGSGQAALAVKAFTELQTAPVQLVPDKPVVSTLGDGEQRSWWVVIKTAGYYSFEAGGRYVTDLRLWQDGGWMVGATPNAAPANADPEQPLQLEQLTAPLQPGVYRLTAYGGAGLPWAKASSAAPLFLRWGVPALGDAGRSTHVMPAVGIDRFLVPGTAVMVRLVLGSVQAADVAAAAYNAADPFDTSMAMDTPITKTSRDPVAALPLGSANFGQNGPQPWVVTVTAKPGTPYRLEVLNESGGTVAVGPGQRSLLAVTLPGNPDDDIDPGFLLVNNAQQVVAASVIDLDTALPWRRRFNLLGPVNSFLYTSKNINLQVDGAGVAAVFDVARFFSDAGYDQAAPQPQASGGVWPLTPGYYSLAAGPQAKGRGILTLSMYAAGTAPPAKDSARLPAAVFPDVTLDRVNADTLYSTLDSDESFGLRQEALPAALAAPLSMELAPGQIVGIPLALAADAQLTVADEDGRKVAFTLDGQAESGVAAVAKGAHRFSVSGPGPGDRFVTITSTPAALLASTPLPAIPASETLPVALPPVTPGAPVFVDLTRQDTENFELSVPQDALYRFETTGLLATGGAVRTRTNPALAAVQGNGVGRNFLLQTYLREGDYQLAVSTLGASTGHAGISVRETPLIDAGVLAPGQPARLTLLPGQAASYRFHIGAEGTYHLYTLGLGHPFNMRLEDAAGWPLITPGRAADVTMDFQPGDYRMILLPGTVENRAVTVLQPLPPPITYQGHGPFDVVFGTDLADRWMEPKAGQARVPDAWRFTLPAAATVSLSISNGMQAVLTGAAGRLASTTSNWSGKLPAGDYTVQASAVVTDNRLDYTLNVGLTELIPGQSQMVAAPATIPVSLGGGAQYDIWSLGDQDVRAVLYDAAGHELAADDDRDNDWNFLISGSFPPGAYKLEVDPVGTAGAQTQVFITAPAAVTEAPLQPGKTVTFADGLVHVLPLPAVPAGSLLLAGVQAAVPVGLALQAQTPAGGWDNVSSTAGVNPTLAMPAGPDGVAHRLTVWAEDHGASPIAVTADAVTPPVAGLGRLADGLPLTPVRLGGQEVYVGHVAVAAPVLLSLAADMSATLVWGGVAGAALAHDATGNIAANGPFLWLADAAPGTITAAPADFSAAPVRLALAAGQAFALPVHGAGGLTLWQASAQGAQPGLSVDGGPMVVGGDGLLKTAAAFQPAGAARLRLWQAAGRGGMVLTLQRQRFAAPAWAQLAVGVQDGQVAAGSAVRAALPPGWKRLALSLPQGMVGVLLQNGQAGTLVQGGGTAPDILETAADTLLLLNPGVAAPYSVSIAARSQPDLVLAPGGLLTQYSATPAVLHIAIPSGAMAALHLGGTATDVTALSAAGQVSSGADAQAGAGSTLLVTVQPGLAVVALDGAAPSNQLAAPVAAPGSASLSGRHMWLTFPPGPARLVEIATGAPVIIRNLATGTPDIFPAGAADALFQPKGAPLTVELDAAGGQSLSGTAQFAAIPALPISEGLGPQVLAAPGQSRLFSFSLTQTQTIGVGVHGSVDDASLRLLGSDGSVLARGVIAMQKLPPGTYYLALDVPADAAASVIQPALVGKTLPDDGPPADVEASYRE